jgi:hypothetical protein
MGIYFFLMVIVMNSSASPIKPVGPVDVAGRVTEITWVPEQKIKSRPGMSGSLGHDRINPAHFLVTLIDYEGVTSETAVMMTRYINWTALKGHEPPNRPSFILLKINHNNKNYLKKGWKIRVVGYTVRGDEGGTWTAYKAVEIFKH